jgi:hypothetical protein
MPQIRVNIGHDGKVTIKTKGFRGKACLKATAGLERALGGSLERTATSEMRLSETASERSHDVEQ